VSNWLNRKWKVGRRDKFRLAADEALQLPVVDADGGLAMAWITNLGGTHSLTPWYGTDEQRAKLIAASPHMFRLLKSIVIGYTMPAQEVVGKLEEALKLLKEIDPSLNLPDPWKD
jgi:hypothetical protein